MTFGTISNVEKEYKTGLIHLSGMKISKTLKSCGVIFAVSVGKLLL